MLQLMRARPSEMLGLTDSWAAWCVDEAIVYLLLELKNGRQLKHPKTTDNTDLLKAAGVI